MRIWKKTQRRLLGVSTALLSLVLSLSGDTIKKILEQLFGNTLSGLLYSLAALGVAALILYLISRAARPTALRALRKDEQPSQLTGLILLVGPGRREKSPEETAAEPAIEYHRFGQDGTQVLRVCWLVTSKEGFGYAAEMKKHYEPLGIKIPEPLKVQNAFDVRETFELVSRIYNEDLPKEGLNEDQVIADLTGATRPMTIGMALACTINNRNRQMQYMLGGGYGAPYKTEAMLIKFEAPAA